MLGSWKAIILAIFFLHHLIKKKNNIKMKPKNVVEGGGFIALGSDMDGGCHSVSPRSELLSKDELVSVFF